MINIYNDNMYSFHILNNYNTIKNNSPNRQLRLDLKSQILILIKAFKYKEIEVNVMWIGERFKIPQHKSVDKLTRNKKLIIKEYEL